MALRKYGWVLAIVWIVMAASGKPSCRPDGDDCSNDNQCCNRDCNVQCQPVAPPCARDGVVCSNPDQVDTACCDGYCNATSICGPPSCLLIVGNTCEIGHPIGKCCDDQTHHLACVDDICCIREGDGCTTANQDDPTCCDGYCDTNNICGPPPCTLVVGNTCEDGHLVGKCCNDPTHTLACNIANVCCIRDGDACATASSSDTDCCGGYCDINNKCGPPPCQLAIGDSCEDGHPAGECCNDPTHTLACDIANVCCIRDGDACTSPSQDDPTCCGGYCDANSKCGAPPSSCLLIVGNTCEIGHPIGKCCDDQTHRLACVDDICCVRDGDACHNPGAVNTDCCGGYCTDDETCGYPPCTQLVGDACSPGHPPGLCCGDPKDLGCSKDTTCCYPDGEPCGSPLAYDLTCCSGYCGAQFCSPPPACLPDAQPCTVGDDGACCSGYCAFGSCATPICPAVGDTCDAGAPYGRCCEDDPDFLHCNDANECCLPGVSDGAPPEMKQDNICTPASAEDCCSAVCEHDTNFGDYVCQKPLPPPPGDCPIAIGEDCALDHLPLECCPFSSTLQCNPEEKCCVRGVPATFPAYVRADSPCPNSNECCNDTSTCVDDSEVGYKVCHVNRQT